jgi:hypothetical protein
MANITEPGVIWTPVDPPANVKIPSQVYWRSSSPLEITVVFGQVEEDYEATDMAFIRWVFSRDLIPQARAAGQAGLGDVQVTINGDRLILQLDSPQGRIKLSTSAETIMDFVRRTYVEVGDGYEADMLPLSDDALREAMLDWGLM